MAKKIKNLSPKSSYQIKSASEELAIEYVAGALPFGESMGGVQMFSKSFKRGYGDKVFGSDDNGIWLGAADFADAPFSVDMDGNMTATSLNAITRTGTNQTLSGEIEVGNGNVLIDGVNARIIINDGSYDRILIGKQIGGF